MTPTSQAQDCEHEWTDAGDKPGLKSGDQLCLKCLDIKRASTAQDWEKEFDHAFGVYWTGMGNVVYRVFPEKSNHPVIIPNESIKAFIRSRLDEQKARILDRVDRWRHTKEMQSTMYNRTMGDGVRRIIEES